MVNVEGLTSRKWKLFEDLLIVANTLQVEKMQELVFAELAKRNARK